MLFAGLLAGALLLEWADAGGLSLSPLDGLLLVFAYALAPAGLALWISYLVKRRAPTFPELLAMIGVLICLSLVTTAIVFSS